MGGGWLTGRHVRVIQEPVVQQGWYMLAHGVEAIFDLRRQTISKPDSREVKLASQLLIHVQDMLHNGQRLTDRIVQRCSRWWRLYGREPCGILCSRSTILRCQSLLIFGYAVLDGVPRGIVQGVQEAAETRTDGCQLSVVQRRRQGLGLASRPLGQLLCDIRLHGREEGLAFGSPFIGQGTELVGTPLFCAHDSSPSSASCSCVPRDRKGGM